MTNKYKTAADCFGGMMRQAVSTEQRDKGQWLGDHRRRYRRLANPRHRPAYALGTDGPSRRETRRDAGPYRLPEDRQGMNRQDRRPRYALVVSCLPNRNGRTTHTNARGPRFPTATLRRHPQAQPAEPRCSRTRYRAVPTTDQL